MGASSWRWQVSFREDLVAALGQARQEAYDRGAYYREENGDEQARSMTEEEYVTAQMAGMPDPDMDTGFLRDMWRAANLTVTGPDSLLRAQPFSQTHSVIDMTSVGTVRDYGRISPTPDEDLLDWFGNTRPPVEAVESRALSVDDRGFVLSCTGSGIGPLWIT